MIERIKTITKDQVLIGTFIVTVGIFTASVFSYLLQFILGRLLTVADYGTFNALLAFASIAGVPAMVVSTSLIKLASELKAKNRFDQLTQLYWKLSFFALVFAVLISAFFASFHQPIADFFNIQNADLFYYFGPFLGLTYLLIVPAAYLQGLLRFKAYALYNVLGGLFRFVFPVILVIVGLGLPGVFMGIAMSVVLMYALSTLLTSRNFIDYNKESLQVFYKKIVMFGLPVLLVNLGMILMNNMDIILVKKYFDELSAGYYAGTVTVSKVLLFGAGTVVVVMFPQISEAYSKGEDYTGKLKKFLALQLLLVVGGVVVFTLLPGLIAGVMFGEKFLPSVPYIPLFSLFVGVYVLINFMVMFLLAINKTKVALLQIPAVIAQYILIYYFHDSLTDVIKINLFVAVFLLVTILLYYVKHAGFHNRSRVQTRENY